MSDKCAGGIKQQYSAQGTLPCPDCGATSKEPCGREVRRLAERDAVLTYLLEFCSHGYGGTMEPVEFGINWEWRQSTPYQPGIYEALCDSARERFTRYINEMSDLEEPTEWDREIRRHLTALGPTP